MNPYLVKFAQILTVQIVIQNSVFLFLHSIRRVSKHHIRLLSIHKKSYRSGIRAVTAHQPMFAKLPYLTEFYARFGFLCIFIAKLIFLSFTFGIVYP